MNLYKLGGVKMKGLKSLLSRRSKIENKYEEDVMVELNKKEIDEVMAVGNSIEVGKWFLNEDIKYMVSKRG